MRLVGLINGLGNASYRYRLGAFERVLNERGWDVSVHALPSQWIDRLLLLHRLENADVVFLQRRLLSPLELMVLRRSARRLVYDFDDAVFYRSSNSSKGPHSRRRKSRFCSTLRAADAVIAGNAYLAEFASTYISADKVHMIPTCVDPEAYGGCKGENLRSGTELVWIGSKSTLQAILRIPEHFEAVTRAVPQARLKIISDVFPRSLPIAVVRCPWSVDTEVQALASADVGISWMPDDLWSRGKCGLKVLQYMAAGLPVIANPVGIHREIIVHGRTGLLAEKPEEWASAVRTLTSDPDLRCAMGKVAREIVTLQYNTRAWTDKFIGLIAGTM